jgi:hypothetical protein
MSKKRASPDNSSFLPYAVVSFDSIGSRKTEMLLEEKLTAEGQKLTSADRR